MNMETTHPGITQDFDDGIISIRRTSKPFSASAIDLTLEQTQNKDAANSSTGKKFINEYIATCDSICRCYLPDVVSVTFNLVCEKNSPKGTSSKQPFYLTSSNIVI